MSGFQPSYYSRFLLILALMLTGITILGAVSAPTAATLTGIVTNSVTGSPIIGAIISVGTLKGWSVAGGSFTVTGIPPGTWQVTCAKSGFDSWLSLPITFQQGVITTMNIAMDENLNPPVSAVAALDTLALSVQVSWSPPSGSYELLYDDGIQDDFTIWFTQGNMNGVRFSPAGYPMQVTGGSVNIGQPSNYPPGSTPLVPFQMAVYDATGPGGMPGTLLGGPLVVIPMEYGWIEFSFPSPVSVTSGSFYLVMIQGGNAPNAAGLAIDQTNPQLRSCSKFVTGGGPWFPGDGNYMIRAQVSGPGGPFLMTENPENLILYQVWRLRQGEEMNPVVWTSVGITTSPGLIDASWPSLPCGPYRWGIKAQYTGNRWSETTFSNIVPKCWTAPVTIQVTLSCEGGSTTGTSVTLTNLVYPDTLYHTILDTSGITTFPDVWKGTYELRVVRFGYITSAQNISIQNEDTLTVLLLQKQSPPFNLEVNGSNLLSIWNRPEYCDTMFSENWSSCSFTTHGWTVS